MVKKPDLLIKNKFLWPVRSNSTARMRRLSVRVNPIRREVVVTFPPSTSLRNVERFLDQHSKWVEERIQQSNLPLPEAPKDGATLSFMGTEYEIRHRKTAQVSIWREEKVLIVSCPQEEQIPPTLKKWIRSIGPYELKPLIDQKAQELGVTYGEVRIKDTWSQWGSCHPKGHLSFNWRLLLAPLDIITYLIAHEVSHLKEANHSVRFWAHVESLCHDYKSARKWLRTHGPGLFGW